MKDFKKLYNHWLDVSVLQSLKIISLETEAIEQRIKYRKLMYAIKMYLDSRFKSDMSPFETEEKLQAIIKEYENE